MMACDTTCLFRIPWCLVFLLRGLPHGNRLVSVTDQVKALPSVFQGAVESTTLADTLYHEYGGVLIWRLNLLSSEIQGLRSQFAAAVAAMQGRMGPWARAGLFTGGGLPHSRLHAPPSLFPNCHKTWSISSQCIVHARYLCFPLPHTFFFHSHASLSIR